jgi:cytochrome c-type biogenesis protein CcmH
VLVVTPAFAIGIDKPLASKADEARAQQLFSSLRCVICAGQTLADSDVSLARDMRVQVRRMVQSGATNQAILDYFTERYGIEVLTTPPARGATAWLWALPVAVALIAVLLLWLGLRGQRRVIRALHATTPDEDVTRSS